MLQPCACLAKSRASDELIHFMFQLLLLTCATSLSSPDSLPSCGAISSKDCLLGSPQKADIPRGSHGTWCRCETKAVLKLSHVLLFAGGTAPIEPAGGCICECRR